MAITVKPSRKIKKKEKEKGKAEAEFQKCSSARDFVGDWDCCGILNDASRLHEIKHQTVEAVSYATLSLSMYVALQKTLIT